MIPVSIVTGFLGSGKTTLIRRVLADPSFANTAVIVNEFGEIGLDHELIAASTENLLALTTGCLCCAIRSDLVATLLELQAKRDAEDVHFDRVLIETSGLADPAPILQALMTDTDVASNHQIDTLLAVVDALHGEAALDRHPEARRQLAFADRVVLSKTDLVEPAVSLRSLISALNTQGPIVTTAAMTPDSLFGMDSSHARAERLASLPLTTSTTFLGARHSVGVTTFTLQRDRPIPALALTLLLQALTEHCGARLMRVKGLVDIEEMPGRPALIHGVQHVFSPPEFLDVWPSADHSTRLVFITQGVPRHFPSRLLDAIEYEVREETAEAASRH